MTLTNGLYGHLAQTAKNKGIEGYQKTSETKEIQLIQEFLGYPAGRVVAKDSDKVMRCIRPIIVRFYKGDLSETKLCEGNTDYGELFLSIKDKLQELSETVNNTDSKFSSLEPYTYLLTQFTYAYRCDYFHASKPIPIFIHTDEADLICLQAMNDFLDEFLEDNLHVWFSNCGVNKIDEFIDGLAG
ncbi:MAG: hypothetical protein PHR37_06690 [Eubacteriales bacterium]|nr:hypothetical protein [Eubacteriales bacterium]